MIEKELPGFPGVRIIELVKHADERGYFLEVLRKSWVANHINQVSVSLTKPGVIKAFHWHNRQQDIWFLLSGVALVALYDLREDSPGFKKKAAFKLDSAKSPRLIIIPKRVAHGYKALGKEPVTMLYAMNEEYNPKEPDEERIPHDDAEIGFDWDSEPEEI